MNTPPGAATNLSLGYEPSGGGWVARVSWAPPGDADLASVRFRLNQDGGNGGWVSLAPSTTFQVVGVGNGARVTADVQAVDTGGLEGPLASVDGGYAPLGAPNNVALTQVGLDRVRASWSAPTGGSVADYRVTFSGGAGGTFTDGAGTGSRDVVAVPGQGVTVTVEARDGAGRYGHAAQASTTPSAPAPGTPGVAAWSYSSVTVQWTSAAWADSYDVEYAVNDGGFAALGNTASNSAGLGVSQDTRYRFRVRARGSSHAGDYSGELRISIGHAAYNTVDAWSATNGAVSIWRDHADGVVVPPNANVTEMEIHLAATFSTSAACCTATRNLVWVANNNAGFPTGNKPNPWDEVVGFNQNGGDLAGLMATGTGWSSAGTGGYRLDGSITVRGSITVNHPEVGNGYW